MLLFEQEALWMCSSSRNMTGIERFTTYVQIYDENSSSSVIYMWRDLSTVLCEQNIKICNNSISKRFKTQINKWKFYERIRDQFDIGVAVD